jgi:hypothetical protein
MLAVLTAAAVATTANAAAAAVAAAAGSSTTSCWLAAEAVTCCTQLAEAVQAHTVTLLRGTRSSYTNVLLIGLRIQPLST